MRATVPLFTIASLLSFSGSAYILPPPFFDCLHFATAIHIFSESFNILNQIL